MGGDHLCSVRRGLDLCSGVGCYDPGKGRCGVEARESGLVGSMGEVCAEDMVHVNGALWKAECDEPLVIGKKLA